jgi:uncharacterized protein (TIGR03083 family)
MLRYDPLACLRTDGDGLIAAAERAGLDAPVPWCPGWHVRDLLYHVGEVWHFWAFVVDEGVTDRAQFERYDEPSVPADADLVAWARDRRAHVWRALGWGTPDQPLWTWAKTPGSVAWVRRRMAQETAVHRWDAEAASGAAWGIDPLLAADGIDEFLQWFTADPAPDASPVGGTVHLHCTDEGLPAHAGEWIVHELTPDGARFDRVHAKGDAAVRGRANDLLLWLWRRPATVDVLGDVAVAERFVARERLG